ncbi:MAG: DUF1326 domain-containing protein [Woeseiaceae bacterium]
MGVKWEVEGPEYANCNCDYGCPCQFNSRPTDGTCKAFGMMRIDKGFFGDISLDGLYMGFLIDFPNAIHEGNGTHQIILDEAGDEDQRNAMATIIRGDETDEFATHWYVYSKMSSTHNDPLIASIVFDIDIENRTVSSKVGDLIDSSCEPIRNPVTGDPHRVRIDLPNGFEYRIAEIGSASTSSRADVPLDLNSSYGQLAHIHLSQSGYID